jgi:pimeloyl-ACP methyl ester carboxylesterase
MLQAHDLTILDLRGRLALPPEPIGLVVIPSTAGVATVAASAKDSYLAAAIGRWGYATFVVDLLKPEEPAETRFDVNLLAARLAGVCKRLGEDPRTASLEIAFLATETAAAAALVIAAERPGAAFAVVSRSGRPDLAGPALRFVTVPTLLVVGRQDEPLIRLNEQAQEVMLRAKHRLELIPEASHDFDEPGTLDEFVKLACTWLEASLAETELRPARPRRATAEAGRLQGVGEVFHSP